MGKKTEKCQEFENVEKLGGKDRWDIL